MIVAIAPAGKIHLIIYTSLVVQFVPVSRFANFEFANFLTLTDCNFQDFKYLADLSPKDKVSET
jgi:hypothetical protein